MSWKPREVSGTTISRLKIIHTRWFKSEAVVPSAIIGASPYYADPKVVDPSRTMSVKISDVTCEGRCPALFRISPLQNYELVVSNIKFEQLLTDDNVELGQSLVGMKISDQENTFTPGQEKLTMGLHVSDWSIGGENVDSTNWQVDQLGQLNIHPDYWVDWSIT